MSDLTKLRNKLLDLCSDKDRDFVDELVRSLWFCPPDKVKTALTADYRTIRTGRFREGVLALWSELEVYRFEPYFRITENGTLVLVVKTGVAFVCTSDGEFGNVCECSLDMLLEEKFYIDTQIVNLWDLFEEATYNPTAKLVAYGYAVLTMWESYGFTPKLSYDDFRYDIRCMDEALSFVHKILHDSYPKQFDNSREATQYLYDYLIIQQAEFNEELYENGTFTVEYDGDSIALIGDAKDFIDIYVKHRINGNLIYRFSVEPNTFVSNSSEDEDQRYQMALFAMLYRVGIFAGVEITSHSHFLHTFAETTGTVIKDIYCTQSPYAKEG